MIKTLQEICSVHCEVPEVISEEIERKTKWRIFYYIFQFVKLFEKTSHYADCVYVEGDFINDVIQEKMPENVDVVIYGWFCVHDVNRCVEIMKKYINLRFLEDTIYFRINSIEIPLKMKFDDNSSLTFDNWNYLIYFCEMKIEDPYHEFYYLDKEKKPESLIDE